MPQSPTDTSEGGLEALIVRDLVARGYTQGDPANYDRQFCVDLAELTAFIEATQPEVAKALCLHEDGATRRAFLARLSKEMEKRGVIDVLRKGIGHNAHTVSLYYAIPSEGNEAATKRPHSGHAAATQLPRSGNAAGPRRRSAHAVATQRPCSGHAVVM